MSYLIKCLTLLVAVAAFAAMIAFGGWPRVGALLVSPVVLGLFYEMAGELWQERPRPKRLGVGLQLNQSRVWSSDAIDEEARLVSLFDSREEYTATMYPRTAVNR